MGLRLAPAKALASRGKLCLGSVLFWLWQLRTSLASIAIATFCLWYFAEIRELFLHQAALGDRLCFAALILIAWALPVYRSAKRALAQPSSLPGHWTMSVPVFLGLATFAAILFGLYLTYDDLTRCVDITKTEQLQSCFKQAYAQDFMTVAELRVPADAIASPTVPNFLSNALNDLQNLAISVVLAAIVFATVVYLGSRSANVPDTSPYPTGSFSYRLPCRPGQQAHVQRWDFLLAVTSAALITWACLGPFAFTDMMGRLAVLPMLFGSWIALVTFLHSALGRFEQYALAAALALVVFVSNASDQAHNVRVYEAPQWQAAQNPDATASSARQINLEDAVSSWKTANGCKEDADACPPLVLIAAEGGASRSAFFVSTVLGALLDETQPPPPAPDTLPISAKYHDLRKLIFAMSGVSGGSLGVTTTRIALQDAVGQKPPCKFTDAGWFGSRSGGNGQRDVTNSWRACLQLLTAGDYLSPTALGFIRDSTISLFSADRAVILEQSIERHYNRVVQRQSTVCEEKDTKGFCAPLGYYSSLDKSRWLPLLLLNATEIDTGRPVLLSDFQTEVVKCLGVSCDAFLPIAHNVFELAATNPRAQRENKADENREVLVSGLAASNDIRLSTAVGLSARFPFISPAGIFQYKHADRVYRTRVVDGGYFDNSGLETINQLLPFLTERNLKPFVIYLANDPWFETRQIVPGRPLYGQSQDRLLDLRLTWWDGGAVKRAASILLEPASTLYTARIGHVEMAKQRLLALQRDLKNIQYAVIKVRNPVTPVYGSMEKKSLCLENPKHGRFGRIAIYPPVMSWWLSPVSQRALDAQLCDYYNTNEIQRVLNALSTQVQANPARRMNGKTD